MLLLRSSIAGNFLFCTYLGKRFSSYISKDKKLRSQSIKSITSFRYSTSYYSLSTNKKQTQHAVQSSPKRKTGLKQNSKDRNYTRHRPLLHDCHTDGTSAKQCCNPYLSLFSGRHRRLGAGARCCGGGDNARCERDVGGLTRASEGDRLN